MTNLAALIRQAKTEARAIAIAAKTIYPEYHAVTAGNVLVRIVPVQPRGTKSWNLDCIRADVYIDDKRLKTSEVKEILKNEAV